MANFDMTQMYGRYTKELGDYVKETANSMPAPVMHGGNGNGNEEFSRYSGKISSTLEVVWRHSFAKLSEDWVFLTLLGLVMAVLSFVMDYGIDFTNEGQYHARGRQRMTAPDQNVLGAPEQWRNLGSSQGVKLAVAYLSASIERQYFGRGKCYQSSFFYRKTYKKV